MLDLIRDLPFSIEAWKTSTILLLFAVMFLSKVYKDYDKLRNKTDKEVEELHNMVKDIEEKLDELIDAQDHTHEKMVDIRIQYEKLSSTIDKLLML